jgi:hypothetical protein
MVQWAVSGGNSARLGLAAPRITASALVAGAGIYSGPVLELNSLDLEEIALALADHEHRRLINPQTREIVFCTAGTTFRPTR